MTVHHKTTGVDLAGGGPVVPSNGRQRPLGLNQMTLTGGFWAALQATNATATLAHCEHWMERVGWLANFDRVATGTTGPDRPGWSFSDSEVYKLIEALCWEYGRSGNPAADEAVHRLTARIAPAQDDDGYLNTCYGHAGQDPRYSDLEMGHELYCVGHLLQAAVARFRTVGPDRLVEIARRAADHVCDTFGAGGRQSVCGHPEIEVGLAEFGRAVGDDRYVEQARRFLERRGNGTLRDIPLGRAYFQDDKPIRTADTWHGHAVRALYLSAAAVDVAMETDDRELLEAIVRQWTNAVARRTYLTGGMGSRHQDEGFGEDWELPADRAYCETCAGIGSVMVSWRLYLATGDVRYADLMERTFYNVIAASPRSDGRAFFYANPLHQRTAGTAAEEEAVSPRAESGTRAPWFDVSCCPTNVARTLATWHTCAASVGDRDLTLLQYASARVRAELSDGRALDVEITTDYPDDGLITVHVVEPPAGPVTLRLRVPEWATGATLEEGGRRRHVEPGFVTVDRELSAAEQIRLRLPMDARFTWPDKRIDAVRGCVAVERGPLVYCAESIDLPEGIDLEDVQVDATSRPVEQGRQVLLRALVGGSHTGTVADRTWPYASQPSSNTPGAPADHWKALDLVLGPYHQWAERAPSAMRVWLPVHTQT